MTGAIITIPLILLFALGHNKINKQPKFTQVKQSNELKGNPKQNGQPLGISSTVKPAVKFKNHSEWLGYIRNERNKLTVKK